MTVPYWRQTLLIAYVAVNVALIVLRIRPSEERIDWRLFSQLPGLLESGTLYAQTEAGRWVWSPVAAWIMAGVTTIGYWPWLGVHFAALAFLRDWRLIGLALVTWGFWVDVQQGHHLVFVTLAAVFAVRGSRPAAVIYFALFLLAPRPLEVPLAAWLLWRDRALWKPWVVVFAVHAALVLASGYGPEWIASMSRQTISGWNLSPAYWLGLAWLIVGIPLGVWLTVKGWPAVAGLAVSHYVLPQYILFVLVDVATRVQPAEQRTVDPAPTWRGIGQTRSHQPP